ncbi:MAG: hypothetical protein AAFR61_27980 [Bacteroidota bacterium]
MICLLHPDPGPRLAFAAKVLFQYLLRVPYCWVSAATEAAEDRLYLSYQPEAPEQGFALFDSGWFALDPLTHPPGVAQQAQQSVLFPAPNPQGFCLGYDILAAVFYLVADVEKYQASHLDHYQRYEQQAYPSADWGLEHRPLAQVYAEELWEVLTAAHPKAAAWRQSASFTYEITWDIDHPWKYLHKSLPVSLGGWVKEWLRGDVSSALERMRSWVSRKDPYFTFEEVLTLSPPERSRFFFLIDRHHSNDSRFTYQLPALQALIRKIAATHPVGIHPSFTSFQDEEKIRHETTMLGHFTDQSVQSARMHYLRFHYPETYRYLLQAGIRHEYTPCLYQQGGFPLGVAVPIPWYDLLADVESELMLHPTLLMDRSLQQYAALSPEAALERTKTLIEVCHTFNGHFTLLLHNDVLSESGEWKGWSAFARETISLLQAAARNQAY